MNKTIIAITLIALTLGTAYALISPDFNNWLNTKIAEQEAQVLASKLSKAPMNTTIQGNLIVTGNLYVTGCIVYDGGTLGKCK